jgi:hypothetical protein
MCTKPMRCLDERVSVPLPADIAEWIKREAERQDRPQAWVIRRCIEMARRSVLPGLPMGRPRERDPQSRGVLLVR